MQKKSFNPSEWLEQAKQQPDKSICKDEKSYVTKNEQSNFKKQYPNIGEENDIEQVIQQIESNRIDLTANYADWRDLGFALVDEYAESGRSYFHRISRFYPHYDSTECDKQYNNCLKAKGHGISIKTLYHKAKQAGINISFHKHRTSGPSYDSKPSSQPKDVLSNVSSLPQCKDELLYVSQESDSEALALSEFEVTFTTPKIPAEIYHQLPEILKESTDMFEAGIEKDVFFIGALSVISACLPNIEGIYFDEPVTAHLYAFITAPAGSGKGKLKWAKYFGMQIHKTIVEQSNQEREEYDIEWENYNNLNKNQRKGHERPKEPKRKMFYIPANSSSSAFIQALADNDFKGIIFETEADTLAGTLKQDWGNFSDVLRKAFHHESTNMFRRKNNEHIEIEDPHLAITLSGTPKQVHNMMPDAENGLFSRFLYYAFEDYSDFKNPFISHCSINYTQFFEEQGKTMYELYEILRGMTSPIRFVFTAEQGERFTQQFNILYQRNRMLLGNDFNANSRRLGLISFRIAMTLRSLRILEDGDTSSPLICNELDFQTAISIAFTLEKHAIAVYQNLPNNNLKGIKLKFYKALPNTFNRQDYLSVAKALKIKDKTAEKYIGQLRDIKLLTHEHNKYTKPVT